MRLRNTALGGAIGAALVYFFDPQNGKRRRKMTVARLVGLLHRTERKGERLARGVAAEAYGVAQKATHLKEEPKEFDDATLAHKVETEIFRDADVPKGQINVNAENGVIVLRGQVEQPDMIAALEQKTRKVQGVRDVQNLLHTPGQEAPSRV
ncbi:MAG TPA: BON domain-containing protein [Gaiellaceae bacterium]